MSNNPQIVPILRAPAESFAADSETDTGSDSMVDAADKGGEGLWAGSQMGVVTGFQTRNNARAMFVGGVEVFSNDFAEKSVEKYVFLQFQVRSIFMSFIFTEALKAEISNLPRILLNGHSKKPRC